MRGRCPLELCCHTYSSRLPTNTCRKPRCNNIYNPRPLPQTLNGESIGQSKPVPEELLPHVDSSRTFTGPCFACMKQEKTSPMIQGGLICLCKSNNPEHNYSGRDDHRQSKPDPLVRQSSASCISNSHQFRARKRPPLRLGAEHEDPWMVLSNARGMF